MNHGENKRRTPPPDRAERLAAALRANLKRRKAQARGRADRDEAAGEGRGDPNQPDGNRRDG